MEEKERYEIIVNKKNFIEIQDTESNTDTFITEDNIEDLLNQQYKENQQLKQQLHDLPKEIVGDIQENFDWRQCCEIRKYYDQQYIWFNYVAFNDFLDTILKKYGGEDE